MPTDVARSLLAYRLYRVVLQHDVAVCLDLVAPDLVVVADRLAGLGIDVAAADAIAGFAVEGVEAHLLAVAGGRRQRHRAGDERQLQVACPVGARRHLGASSGSATPVNARGWRWFRGVGSGRAVAAGKASIEIGRAHV